MHTHLYTFQVLRQWYRDRSIEVIRPELRKGEGRPELLFWIDRETQLFQIDLRTFHPRSVTTEANPLTYLGVLRSYARGLAESGELDRAVWILLNMPKVSAEYRWLDRRLAASYLLAFGRSREALQIVQDAPPLDRSSAISIAVEFLAQPTRVPRYDRATLVAFDLDYGDAADVAAVMGRLSETKSLAAPRFAVRLLELRPGDVRALALLKAYEAVRPNERLTPEQPSS